MPIQNASKNIAYLPLHEEYELQKRLFEVQPSLIQHFIETQGKQLAEAVSRNAGRIHFKLPDRVIPDVLGGKPGNLVGIPSDQREQETGGLIDRLTRTEPRAVLYQRLVELEGSKRRGVSTAAGLIRFATAQYMVNKMLPSGRTIIYSMVDGEEIPSMPQEEKGMKQSAIEAAADAIVEEGGAEDLRGELQAPFTAEARRFFLPQWVAFDLGGNLLVSSEGGAEAHIASMQRFIGILHAAVSLAPYFVVDRQYQKKRYGMLGQLVNQGRSLALYQTKGMIQIIKKRAATHDLNRGLSLSLPYFDDQLLSIQTHDFVVIPAGRIMFIPSFVVRAAYEEQAKVAQDTRLNASTRKYLISELELLKKAFENQ
jgi:hypothetical protein